MSFPAWTSNPIHYTTGTSIACATFSCSVRTCNSIICPHSAKQTYTILHSTPYYIPSKRRVFFGLCSRPCLARSGYARARPWILIHPTCSYHRSQPPAYRALGPSQSSCLTIQNSWEPPCFSLPVAGPAPAEDHTYHILHIYVLSKDLSLSLKSRNQTTDQPANHHQHHRSGTNLSSRPAVSDI